MVWWIAFAWLGSMLPAAAQYDLPENRNWVFGFFAGLDFNGGSPVPFATSVSGSPGSAQHTGMASVAVSDRNGELLFYTNGSHTWDRTHTYAGQLHPFVVALSPVTQVTTQGTLAVPVTGDPDLHYIFSLTHPGTHAIPSVALYGKLHYSIWDARMRGGLGAPDPGRSWLQIGEGLADKMVAIPGNECNIWLVVHSLDTNAFLAYEITSSGIRSAPVVSYAGSARTIPSVNGGRNTYWTNGQMSVSTDFRRLAIASDQGHFIEMFDFDPNTGVVSGGVTVDTAVGAYGLAFSPDGSRLYAWITEAAAPGGGHIYQYDLHAGSPPAIRQSRQRLHNDRVEKTQLKLGPDKRIYFGANGNLRGKDIGAIWFPDVLAPACGYDPRVVHLPGNSEMIYGLSHEVTRAADSFFSRQDVIACNVEQQLEAPEGYTDYFWQDGLVTRTRTVSAEGVYIVGYRSGCRGYSDTFVVMKPVGVDLGDDTLVCNSTVPLTIRPETRGSVQSYLWSDGSTRQVLVTRRTGTYWLEVTDRDGCTASDTLEADWVTLDAFLGRDTLVCGKGPLELMPALSGGASFLWSDGSTDSLLAVTRDGSYWVMLSHGDCVVSDTVDIAFAGWELDLGEDISWCGEQAGNRAGFSVTVPEGARIQWQDGSSAPYFATEDTGTIYVAAEYRHCKGGDTVRISAEICECTGHAPTAFSPNGDGRNDVFRVLAQSDCAIHSFQLEVFNRWGVQVFAATDISSGWDGLFRGVPAEPGVYMYYMRMVAGSSKKPVSMKGDLTLIR